MEQILCTDSARKTIRRLTSGLQTVNMGMEIGTSGGQHLSGLQENIRSRSSPQSGAWIEGFKP